MNAFNGARKFAVMRSKLFVPASRPELFSKALASPADAICFDLEDSVLPAQKAEARIHMREFLSKAPKTHQTILVRVNGLSSGHLEKDLSASVHSSVTMLNLPKVEDPSEIREVAEMLRQLESERSIVQPIAILATIESPRGLRLAEAIAGADPRVAGLQLGLADLFEPLGIQHGGGFAADHIRLRLRLAAGEAGVPCFDSAFPGFADVEGFAAEAAIARSMGFAGKSCIHPCQIAPANQIFSPAPEEIAMALRIVEAACAASATGLGAFAMDGRMIDEPFVQRAENVLQLAEDIRVRNGESE
jgi:citrate lyase subunit beta/citryl-CoA lyase